MNAGKINALGGRQVLKSHNFVRIQKPFAKARRADKGFLLYMDSIKE